MIFNQAINDLLAADPHVRPISNDDARRILREAFRDRQHWLFMVDGRGFALVERLLAHYPGDDPAAARAVAFPSPLGKVFALVCLRKAELSARQLQRHLQEIGIYLSRREVAEKDVFVATESRWNDAAAILADEILSDPASRRVVYQKPMPPIWGCPN